MYRSGVARDETRTTYGQALTKDFVRDKQLYLLLLPFLAYFLLFKYKPMYGLLIAFKDYSVFREMQGSP